MMGRLITPGGERAEEDYWRQTAKVREEALRALSTRAPRVGHDSEEG